MKALREKAGFLAAVFGVLLFQTSLAYGVMTYAARQPRAQAALRRFFWLLMLLMFGLVIAISMLPVHPAVKFLLFAVVSCIMGIVLSRVAALASEEIVRAAAVGTVAIFAAMLAVGTLMAVMGWAPTWLGGVLFAGLLLLLVARVVTSFMPKATASKKVLTVASLMLFSAYVAYDTTNILARDYNGDAVTAALDYFLDVVNIFGNVLKLSMDE